MKWEKNDAGALPVKSWCETCEETALQQADNLARHPALVFHVALMPDAHCGYGMPIGGVVAADNAIIPSAVGVDIGCGMIATETDIPEEAFAEMTRRREFQQSLKKRIPVGEGVHHKEPQEWEGFEEYADKHGSDALGWPSLLDRHNLGTLGGGNHFVEMQKGNGKIWLMIHSGSRNLGQRVEKLYHSKAAKLCTRWKIKLPDRDLAFLPLEDDAGAAYFRDMQFALRYAKENRRRMMEVMKETLLEFEPNATFVQTIDIHHNYATFEKHFGKTVCIHRKGATSAKKDEIGIIPGSMGTASYIVRGLGNVQSFMSCSHGAGRRMSRTAASNNLTAEECDKAMEGIVCERWKRARGYAKGKLDLSEAPQAYKDIEDVIGSETDLVEPVVRLLPLASLKG